MSESMSPALQAVVEFLQVDPDRSRVRLHVHVTPGRRRSRSVYDVVAVRNHATGSGYDSLAMNGNQFRALKSRGILVRVEPRGRWGFSYWHLAPNWRG